MFDERYSIHVDEECVEIRGVLTIEEAFDFMNFFEKKGYNSLAGGCNDSTLLLRVRHENKITQEFLEEQDSLSKAYESQLEYERLEHKKTKDILESHKSLIKNLIYPDNYNNNEFIKDLLDKSNICKSQYEKIVEY